MKRTALFKWKLVQIAKKFGAIDPDADYERMSFIPAHRAVREYRGPEGSIPRALSVYMDVEAAARVVNLVRQGTCEIELSRLSILGAEGLFSSRDQLPPPTQDQAVLATLRRRIDLQEIVLACMHCRKWKSRTLAGRVQEHPVCPKCGARLIAVLKPYEEPLYAIASKKEKASRREESRPG